MDTAGWTIRAPRRPWRAAALLVLAAGLLSASAVATVRPRPEYAYGHSWRAGGAADLDAVNFHVVASSDAPADQALKLRVRDAVTPVVLRLVAGARSADEAQAAVLRERARLERLAAQALRAAGASHPVRVEVLATGERRAVRVVIGRGAGHNWWCVLYPPVCLAAGGTASPAGTLPAQVGDPAVTPPVVVRSALLDWLGAARQRLAARGLFAR